MPVPDQPPTEPDPPASSQSVPDAPDRESSQNQPGLVSGELVNRPEMTSEVHPASAKDSL